MRMWKKGTPHALLVRMLTGAATVESNVEIPQKIKNGSTFHTSYPSSGNISKEPKTLIQKNISTSMFIAALFTITKIQKQPKCPSVDERIKQLWNIYTMEYYLAMKKEENFTLCDSMDGPREHYAKGIHQSEKNKYCMISLICRI